MAMPRVRMATTTITRDTSQASGDGLLLVLAEVHAGQAHQQEGRGGQRGDGEADGHLTQDSGAADIYTGDAEALGGLSQHGEYAVVEGVGTKSREAGIPMMPMMRGKNLPIVWGMMETSVLAISVIMPVPCMMPVKQPAAKSTEHIMRASLAWASTRALESFTLG